MASSTDSAQPQTTEDFAARLAAFLCGEWDIGLHEIGFCDEPGTFGTATPHEVAKDIRRFMKDQPA